MQTHFSDRAQSTAQNTPAEGHNQEDLMTQQEQRDDIQASQVAQMGAGSTLLDQVDELLKVEQLVTNMLLPATTGQEVSQKMPLHQDASVKLGELAGKF